MSGLYRQYMQEQQAMKALEEEPVKKGRPRGAKNSKQVIVPVASAATTADVAATEFTYPVESEPEETNPVVPEKPSGRNKPKEW